MDFPDYLWQLDSSILLWFQSLRQDWMTPFWKFISGKCRMVLDCTGPFSLMLWQYTQSRRLCPSGFGPRRFNDQYSHQTGLCTDPAL